MSAPKTDNELILEFRKGRVEAFTELVRRHQRPLINFFNHCCWDRHEAEDLAQDVFLKLAEYLHRYEPQYKFTTLLYKVARNLWIDRIRAGAADRKTVSLDVSVGAGREGSLGDRLASHAPTPTEITTRKEVTAMLLKAVGQLSQEQRIVVVLCELQGMKYHEVSEVLEIPVGTVKSRLHHAIEQLREIIGKESEAI